MTHIVFGTRGIWASMNQFISDLNSQRFWWRRKDMNEFLPNGKPNPNYKKIIDVPVQGILRPFMIYEYVFPSHSPIRPGDENSPMEDNTQLMLRSFDIMGPDHYIPKHIGKYVKFVGKRAGLEPIPKVDPLGPIRAIHLIGISIVPLGVKADEYRVHDFGDAGKFEQEGI